MQVGKHFHVDRDPRRPCLHEGLDVLIGVGDHQVHVQRNGGHAVHRLHDRRPHRQVRHEVPVHDVDVQQVGSATLDRRDLLAQRGEVRCQERWRDCERKGIHWRLTSSEMASPGAIWNPACGFWRSTMPGGTPG